MPRIAQVDSAAALWRSEDGTTTVEYGLILLLIVIGVIAIAQAIGVTTRGFFEGVLPAL